MRCNTFTANLERERCTMLVKVISIRTNMWETIYPFLVDLSNNRHQLTKGATVWRWRAVRQSFFWQVPLENDRYTGLSDPPVSGRDARTRRHLLETNGGWNLDSRQKGEEKEREKERFIYGQEERKWEKENGNEGNEKLRPCSTRAKFPRKKREKKEAFPVLLVSAGKKKKYVVRKSRY